jgi:hypothetical protein
MKNGQSQRSGRNTDDYDVDDDEEEEEPPPPPSSRAPGGGASSGVSVLNLDALVRATVADERATAQVNQAKPQSSSETKAPQTTVISSQTRPAVAAQTASIRSSGEPRMPLSSSGVSHNDSTLARSAAVTRNAVRMPDGDMVETRGMRSVSMASQAELQEIMTGLASAHTADEALKYGQRTTQWKAAALPSGKPHAARAVAAPQSTSTTPALAQSASLPSISAPAASVSATSSTSSRGAPDLLDKVINVDLSTLDRAAWNEVLLAFDQKRDLVDANADASATTSTSSSAREIPSSIADVPESPYDADTDTDDSVVSAPASDDWRRLAVAMSSQPASAGSGVTKLPVARSDVTVSAAAKKRTVRFADADAVQAPSGASSALSPRSPTLASPRRSAAPSGPATSASASVPSSSLTQSQTQPAASRPLASTSSLSASAAATPTSKRSGALCCNCQIKPVAARVRIDSGTVVSVCRCLIAA